VTGTIAGVARASEETGAAASQVLSAASELSRQSEHLGAEVARFLAQVVRVSRAAGRLHLIGFRSGDCGRAVAPGGVASSLPRATAESNLINGRGRGGLDPRSIASQRFCDAPRQ